MVDTFNKLQVIFARPVTLIWISDEKLIVGLPWWVNKLFEIHTGGLVYEDGSVTPATIWLENLLAGKKRDDSGKMVG
jgi:hypothetical protein